MNKEVTDYIEQAPHPHREIMQQIRNLIHESVEGVKESFKWSRPVFGTTKDFAYLLMSKKHITLGFMHFQKIEDTQNKLEGSGKDMRHIKLKSAEDIDRVELKSWFTSISSQ